MRSGSNLHRDSIIPASTLALVVVLGLAVAAGAGCERGDAPPSESQEAPASVTGGTPGGAEVAPPEQAPCTFSRASRSLVTLNLESTDGTCTIVLPIDARAGTFEVRVAVAGHEGVAAVQLPSPGGDGFLYANEGTVTVTSLDETGVRGRFVATDSNPPNTGGPFAGEFDVAF